MTYTKFAIIAQPRTGSTWLHMLLSSHPQVTVYGELFNPSEEKRRWDAGTGRHPHAILSDNPVVFLEKSIFGAHPGIGAVGFTLFYQHARNGAWAGVREYLRKERVKIIHLKRRNLLDRFLSYELALRSDVWSVTKKEALDYEPIVISPRKCFKDFHLTEWFQQETEELFEANPLLDLAYEDLLSNYDAEVGRVCDFLSVDHHTLSTPMRKQLTKPKSEVIANYDELMDMFYQSLSSGKAWAKKDWCGFFEN